MPCSKCWLVRRSMQTEAGAASVQLALVLPLLAALLLGIIEMGHLFGDVMLLRGACGEGVRVAANGATPTEITEEISGYYDHLAEDRLQIGMDYRIWTGTSWGAWQSLCAGDDDANSAPTGAMLRVTLTYQHRLLMGSLFARLADDPGGSDLTLTAHRYRRRE